MTKMAGMGLRNRHVAIALVIGALALGVRLYGLGDILTADEPRWMLRARDHTRALTHGDLGGTFQGTHPGVVPMFLMGGGIHALELARGSEMEDHEIAIFRLAAKLPVAVATAALIAGSAVVLASLWGRMAGLAAGVLLALDPYLLGHSQLAHVDALLSLLLLAALLVLLRFLTTRQTATLLLSGTLAGLALLTKLPAAVALIAGSATLAVVVRPWPAKLRALAAWLLTASWVFVLLWPSMWLNALPNARYAARDTLQVSTTTHGGAEATESYAAGAAFVAQALARRASPAVILLALGSLLALFGRRRGWPNLDLTMLFGTVGIFLIVLASTGKQADRYLLPVLPILDAVGGLALARFFISARWGHPLTATVLAALVLQALLLSPYAVAYMNPLLAKTEHTQSGWGEGLERAALLLNKHPLGDELSVASWYPDVFGAFFQGRTFSLSSRMDRRVAYVVLYRNMRGRSPDAPATDILAEYAEREPVARVSVLGAEAAWIYATGTPALFSAHVGELVAPDAPASTKGTPTAIEAGQFIPVAEDYFSGVRLAFATFSSRSNTADVVVSVRENPDGPDLRTVRLASAALRDGEWTDARFPPIPQSRGRAYYLAVTSPTGRPGNAVTVRYQRRDIAPGSLVILRRPLGEGESRSAYRREGDLAYELLYAAAAETARPGATDAP